jgi:hypothetical protein
MGLMALAYRDAPASTELVQQSHYVIFHPTLSNPTLDNPHQSQPRHRHDFTCRWYPKDFALMRPACCGTGANQITLSNLVVNRKGERKKVLKNCTKFSSKRKDLKEAITRLEHYLTNNQTRIDYQRYLSSNLMIGSGVVESSNRRVVTQRLKQAGMHWSQAGAEGVMALRAAYLSSSNRWSTIWSS